jgi:hypothetical protein
MNSNLDDFNKEIHSYLFTSRTFREVDASKFYSSFKFEEVLRSAELGSSSGGGGGKAETFLIQPST